MKQKTKIKNCMIVIIIAIGLLFAFTGCNQPVGEDNGGGENNTNSESHDQSSGLSKAAGLPSSTSILGNAYAKYRSAEQMSVTAIFLITSGKLKANAGPLTFTAKDTQGDGTVTLIYQWDKNLITGESIYKFQYTWNNYKYDGAQLNGSYLNTWSTKTGGSLTGTNNFTYIGIAGSITYNYILNTGGLALILNASGGFDTTGTYTFTYNGESQTVKAYYLPQ